MTRMGPPIIGATRGPEPGFLYSIPCPSPSTLPTVSLGGGPDTHSLCLPVSRPALCSLGKFLNRKLPFSICKMERAEKLRDTWGVVKSGMCNKNASRETQGHTSARAKRVIKGIWPHVACGQFPWLSHK